MQNTSHLRTRFYLIALALLAAGYLVVYRVQVALLVKEWVPATRPQIEYLLASASERELLDCTIYLPEIDSAIIYKLEGVSKSSSQKGLQVPLFGGPTRAIIKKQVELYGDQAEALARIWRTREFRDLGNSGRGEDYGIQFFSRGLLLVEACLYYDSMSCCLDTHDSWFRFTDRDDELLHELRFRIASEAATSSD